MNQIDKAFYRVSVKALIKDKDGKIMFLREPDGSWDLPGGGRDFGEDYKTAMKREIQEEIGVNVVSISELPVMFWPSLDEQNRQRLLIVFDVNVDSFNVTLTSEHEALVMQFFSLEEIKLQRMRLHPITDPMRDYL